MFLFSNKISDKDLPIDKKLEHILVDGKYKLQLKRIDSVVILKSNEFGMTNFLYVDNRYLWHKDTVKATVYMSPIVYGTYIEISK